MTPFFASFGNHPRLDFRPESKVVTSELNSRKTPEFAVRMEKILTSYKENITLAQESQAEFANKKRLPAPRYQVGDRV